MVQHYIIIIIQYYYDMHNIDCYCLFGLFEATFTREFEILNQLFNKQFCSFCDPALFVNGNDTIIGPHP